MCVHAIQDSPANTCLGRSPFDVTKVCNWYAWGRIKLYFMLHAAVLGVVSSWNRTSRHLVEHLTCGVCSTAACCIEQIPEVLKS